MKGVTPKIMGSVKGIPGQKTSAPPTASQRMVKKSDKKDKKVEKAGKMGKVGGF